MIKKEPFPKKTEIVDVKDLKLDYEGISFEFWVDPSRTIVSDLMDIVLFTTNDQLKSQDVSQQRKNAKRYFECVSEIIADCSIEGADFSTPESTEKTFELPGVAWGFWYDVVSGYLMKLIETSNHLKKVREALQSLISSGIDNAPLENE